MTDRAEMTRRRNARAREAMREVKSAPKHVLPAGFVFDAEDGAVVREVSAEMVELRELAAAL
jgi:hypothetical protein